MHHQTRPEINNQLGSPSVETARKAEEKYPKLLYSLHEASGTLAAPKDPCSGCDLGGKCPTGGKLSVYCLEGKFTKS